MFEVLYSRNAVYEALRAGRRRFQNILLAKGIKESGTVDQILALATRRKIQVNYLERSQLDRMGEFNHQGVVAQVASYPYVELDEILSQVQPDEHPYLLLLDMIQDPQNLGTLLRTAEAVGVHGVIVPRHRAAQITPAVSNASSGAVEYLRVAQVTNLVRTMEELKDRRVWFVGVEHVPEAQRYDTLDYRMGLGIVVGSEGRGISRLVREHCDFLVQLPMRGKIGSLNAAVAGSIVLYESWMQRLQD